MKKEKGGAPVDKGKALAVRSLMALSLLILLSGLFFSVYCGIGHVSFKVLNTTVSGVFFGLAVAYLGLMYFNAVRKLKKEVYKSDCRFSWSNFKKEPKGSGKRTKRAKAA